MASAPLPWRCPSSPPADWRRPFSPRRCCPPTPCFRDFTFRDLTEDIPAIEHHWQQEGIRFQAVYTGYLGSARQIEMVKDICRNLLVPGGKKIVDPAMADRGELYPVFDMDFVQEMKELVGEGDIVLPNITEASLLTDTEYREEYDEEYICGLVDGIHRLGAGTVCSPA